MAVSGVDIVRLHAPVPLHAPLQPVKADSAAGVALRVTLEPIGRSALHVVPQLSVVPVATTLPVPVPFLLALSVYFDRLKVARTLVHESIGTVQVPVPLQIPLHPANVESRLALGVSVTAAPLGKSLLQVLPQLIPEGEDVTLPVPLPSLVTVSVYMIRVKVAVTVCAAVIDMLHVLLVPVHAPLQPAKVEPLAGVAVKVTVLSTLIWLTQAVPHAMPSGFELMVPAPVPARLIVSDCVTRVNVAVTLRASVTANVQVPVPLQALLQPLNTEPTAAVAVRVIVLP
jgi:hypothetical protein